MKGKKLIVIMAIIILIFTIQASTAFEDDDNYNLTEITDVDSQIDFNTSIKTTESYNEANLVSVSNENVLAAADSDVLGRNIYVTQNTLYSLRSTLINANSGDNIFLNGLTFTGSASTAWVSRSDIHIYGGSFIGDTNKATIDLSSFSENSPVWRLQGDSSVEGVIFKNYVRPNSYALLAFGSESNHMANERIINCEFIDNIAKEILIYRLRGENSALINSTFINNTASLIVDLTEKSTEFVTNSFEGSGNKFINNTGMKSESNPTSSLGLCFKVFAYNSKFDDNTFINNTNAVHGTAYCITGENVIVSNNYIANNEAVYGSGIEAHNGHVSVYNTTFIGNIAQGNHSRAPERDGSGAAIAFVGPDNYMENCTFIDNVAANYAGAIDIIGANTVIVNSRFTNNTAKLSYAGAVSLNGDDTKIDNCTFIDNHAVSGGAVELNGLNVHINNSTFTNNSAVNGGACNIEGYNSTISNSLFTGNDATHDLANNVVDSSSITTAGGAIFIKGNNSNIINNTFTDNSADGQYSQSSGLGGAVYIEGGNITFQNGNFTNNSAMAGGAIYIQGDGIDVDDLNFTENNAILGGAVYIEGNNITINKTNSKSNLAIQGGAIHIEGLGVDIINSEFEGNNATKSVDVDKTGAETLIAMGGAIHIDGDGVEVYDNVFVHNSAIGTFVSGGLGGAVSIIGTNSSIFNNEINNNDAIRGGAIYIQGSNATVKNMTFYSNNAVHGGSIYVEGQYSNITNNTFYDNNATHNLGFSLTEDLNRLPTCGGAIYVKGDESVIYLNNFTYNVAVGINPDGGHGGAIYVEGYLTNITSNIFNENEAILGGAIYIEGTNATVDNQNFTNNNAIRGGAVFARGVNTTLSNLVFEHNNATHSLTYDLTDEFDKLTAVGGAVTVDGNNTLLDNIKFYNNTAHGVNPNGGLGGAIAINGYETTVKDVEFIENQAIRGGALYINGTFNYINHTHFANNSAIRGGALFNYAEYTTVILASVFDNNTATHDLRFEVNDALYSLTAIGGAVAIQGASVNVTDCEFKNNTAIGIFEDGGLGGAIAVDGSDNYIINSTFKENEAIKGGAFYLEGDGTIIRNSSFADNNAIKGGAGYIEGENSVIEDSNFIDNDARHDLRFSLSDELQSATTAGGAIYIVGNNINVTSSNFTDNDAKATSELVSLGGGAFYIEGNNANISSSSFYNNTALKGGAIFITGNDNSFYDSNFTQNSVTNFTVMEGFGGAVYLENAHNSDFTRCSFENNTASINGGAIDWHEGATDGQIINCTFQNNSAGANAGAIFWFGQGGIIKGSNFTNNVANGDTVCAMGNSGDGGAIMWTGSDGTVDDCNFINNTAKDHGGAIFLRGVPGRAECDNNSFINSHFENNTAGSNGGAIDWHEYASNGTIANSTFENNTALRAGGAVFWNGEQGVIQDSNFTNNKVILLNPSETGKGGDGGAITWLGPNGLVDGCNFINNTAPRLGGAVYLESSELCSADNTTFANSNFENNTAGINGGAINWHEGATNGRIENSSFVNNTARANGGAVFWFGTNGTIVGSNFTDNNALGEVPGTHAETGCGGAVIWTGSEGIVDDCIFINNTANRNGGAVYLRNLTENGCNNTSFVNSCFENNAAGINGGAIDWHDGATNGRIENSSFVNNTARANGGAVFWFGTNGTIEGSNFTNNRALGETIGAYGYSGEGGAVIWTGSNGFVDNCEFINNTAANRGGAVYLRNLTENGCNNTTFVNSHFENNTAGTNGGAIDWNKGATNGRIENSTFVNNTANRRGGAVYWNGEIGAIIGSNFTNNRATGLNKTENDEGGDGGAIAWFGSDGIVDGCNFANNTANRTGGAVYIDLSEDLNQCDNTTFVNSHFGNNLAGTNGGAINWHEGATNGRIENSTFENNTALANAGAVSWFGTDGVIVGSNFTNNKALGEATGPYGNSGQGGAVTWTGSNGLVDGCVFENNSAENCGGAVYLKDVNGLCNNTTFANSKFINNSAVNEGGAIDWNEGATYGSIINSTFENNTATDGGAVSWTGHNGQILDSNFTANNATRNGGAVRWSGLNGIVDNSRFTDNEATYGGAVFLQNCAHGTDTNVSITDSYFENNTASEDGGAINWHLGTNATVDTSTFVNNTAIRGGALFINGSDGNVKGSNFTANEAILGGSVYLNNEGLTIGDSKFSENVAVQGGAIYVGADNNNIAGSSFNYNNATYTFRASTTGNDNKTKGGAIYVNGENTVIDNSKFYNNTAVATTTGGVLDDGLGGAVFIEADNNNVTSSEFDWNVARNGSAIYNDASGSYFENDTLIKNQAWSYTLDVNATPNSTYLGLSVSIKVENYTGGDNILNGMYNAKTVNDVTFKDVTYIINSDESQKVQTVNSNPVLGAVNSDGGVLLYQDSLERYQKIIVEFIDKQTGEVVAVRTVRTDLYGNNTFDISDLTPGNYTVKAYHPEDRNYKYISALSSLEILPSVDLSITKEVSDYYIIKGNEVIFTVVVSNAANASNATNLVIEDVLPEGLSGFEIISISKGSFESNKWTISQLDNGTNATLVFKLLSQEFGKFNNTVNVTCDEHDWNLSNNNATVWFEVVPFNLTINKSTDVVGNISVHDEVTFTINITNNALVDATNVIVTDIVPGSFEFVRTNDTNYNPANGILTIDNLPAGESYLFNITLKAMTNGTLTNIVNVTCDENTTFVSANASVNVTPVVILTVVKSSDFDDYIIGDTIVFTITVTNNGPSNATNIKVVDVLPEGLTLHSDSQLENTIDFIESGHSAEVIVKANTTRYGTFTNLVNVSCEQNSTNKSASESIYVFNTDLRINKTANVTEIPVEGYVQFNITVKNHGRSTATNIKIADVLPEEFEVISSNLTYERSGQIIVWGVGSLAEEESFGVELIVKARTNGTFTNVAYTNCTEEPTVNQHSAAVKVNPVVTLSVVKTVNVTEGVEIGVRNLVNFTINVTNNGISNATGVNILDIVPAGFEFVGTNASDYNDETGLLIIPLIQPGYSYVFNITLRVTDVGTLTNHVNVTCNENDTVVKANAGVLVVPVSLTVNKTADMTVVGNNTLVNFTIVVNNTSRVGATGIVVKDLLPGGFTFDSASDGYHVDGKVVYWDAVDLENGANKTYWVVARSNAIGLWDNTVNATCHENDTVVKANSTVSVVPVNMTVNKTANVTVVGNNTLVNFTVVVNNTSLVNATAIVLRDLLPDGFTFDSASDGYYVDGKVVYWDAVDLENGTNKTYWIVARSNAVGLWDNTVNATCHENDTVVKANASVNVVSVSLTVNKAANVTVVGNNTLVNFTIVVNNTGEFNATGITISDLLPIGFTFDSASEGAQRNGQTVYWDSITLQTGMNKTVWISARSNDVGLWDNVVTVQCIENNTVIEDNAGVLIQTVNATLVKTANLTVIGNNTLVNFTIKFNHTSLVNATNVVISDVLPDGFAFDSASADYRRDGQTVSWHFDTVKPGENMTFWIVARSNSTGTYTNTVTVGCDENSTIIAAHEDVEVFEVNVTLNKTANVTVVGNNTLVNFTIVVNNTSLVNATDVVISDVLPNGFTFESASGDYVRDGQTIKWSFDNLETGAIERLWIVARSNATGEWNNIVDITSHENSTMVGSNAVVKVVEVNATLTKTANVTVVGNNTLVNFTIVVNNTALVNATNVTIRDVLPNGFVFEDAASGFERNGQIISWHFDCLQTGAIERLWIVARSNATGEWNNIVNASCDENSTILGNNAAVSVVPVNLTVNKTANVTVIANNTLVNFTIVVNNTGKVNATGIEIKDILPDGFEFVDASDASHVDGQLVYWDSVTIENGTDKTYWITARSRQTGTFNNTVNVTSHENSTIVVGNASVEVVPVNLTVIKIATPNEIYVDELVNFTIRVKNNALVNATNVEITDIIDLSVFEIREYNGTLTQNDDGKLVWTIDLLAPGEMQEVWVVVKALHNATYVNSVNVTSSENRTVSNNNTTVLVKPIVILTIEKTVNVGAGEYVGIFETVDFTVRITNTGLSNATNVVVTDVIPEGFAYSGCSADGYNPIDGVLVVPLIEPNVPYEFTISLTAMGSGVLTNVANVTCLENDTLRQDNASIEVLPLELILNKTANVTVVGNNTLVNFTIEINNTGLVNATYIYLRDVLPEGLIFVNATEGYSQDGQIITWDLEKLAHGSNTSYWIVVKTSDVGSYINNVSLYCAELLDSINDSAAINVVPVNLTVNKTASVSNASVGDEITFTINVTNNGQANATNIVVKDVLPEGFELTEGNLQTTIDFLESGASYVITIKVKATAEGNLTNNVSVFCNENVTAVDGNATVEVFKPVLSIIKTASVSTVRLGDTINFTIEVKNIGKLNLHDVEITDVLDTSAFSLISSNGTLQRDGARLIWNVGQLNVGDTYKVWIVVQTVNRGTFTNTAIVSNNGIGVNQSAATIWSLQSGIAVMKTANDDFVYSGNQTSFTIKVMNTGDTVLTGVFIDENIPEGLIYDHFIGTNWVNQGNRFLYRGSLAVGESVELIIVVNTTRSGNFTNNVVVGSDASVTNSAQATVVVYTPVLSVREIANNPVAVLGESVSFTVIVTNDGDCELDGIYVLNNFPEGLTYTGFSGSGWSKVSSAMLASVKGFVILGASSDWTQDGDKFVYSGTLKPGESASYTLYFDTTQSGVFTPEAVASSSLTDDAYANNTTVVLKPELEVSCEADKDSVKEGEEVTFTVTVTNTGECDLGDIYVNEYVPDGLTYTGFNGDNWTKDGNKFIYSGKLAPGESATFTVMFDTTKTGNLTYKVAAGSNATSEMESNDTVEVLKKDTPKPKPKPGPKPGPKPKPSPKPGPKPGPKPSPGPVKPGHGVSSKAVVMKETGNPIILLLLVILACIPLKRRKH